MDTGDGNAVTFFVYHSETILHMMRSMPPLIGLTAYEKTVSVNPLVEMAGIATAYKDAVIAAGGLPVLMPINLEPPQIDRLLDRLDGILLPGGGDIDPRRYNGGLHENVRGVDGRRDAFELHVARRAVELDIPVLAICRGHQVLNVALGGTLWLDVGSQMPDSIRHDYYGDGIARDLLPHGVLIEEQSHLARLIGTTQSEVNSIHHQGIRDLADDLTPTAFAPDGLIEAVEIRGHRFGVGVQWHPECIVGNVPIMRGLFEGLVAAASAYAAERYAFAS